jgi:hypothetical protein
MNIKTRIPLIVFAAGAGAGRRVAGARAGHGPRFDPKRLMPKTEHRFASRLATRFINGYHYHPGNQEDLSERISTSTWSCSTAIACISPLPIFPIWNAIVPHLHDALKSADLEPAFDIFNRYVRRVGERTDTPSACSKTDLISPLTRTIASIAPNCHGRPIATSLTMSGASGSRTTGCCSSWPIRKTWISPKH